MIRFLAEYFRRSEFKPEQSLSVSIAVDQAGVPISKIDCSPHPTAPTYWTDWGGSYDNIETTKIAVFLNGYLDLVESIPDLIFQNLAMLKGTDCVYIASGDRYPWQYPEWQTEISLLEGYSTAVPDPLKPSDDKLDGRRYPVRLDIPSMQIKLSDSISGTALQNATFSISLINNDGFFDTTESDNIFNVPLYILKSIIEKPAYADYHIIRRGFVDDITINYQQMSIKAATVFRSLSDKVCKTITAEAYPDAADNLEKVIPVAWGVVTVEPILIAEEKYLLIDPDYLVSIIEAYDSAGDVIPPEDYHLAGGVMTIFGDPPEKVKIQAREENTIGEIVTSEIQEKSRILYSSGNWDTLETDSYISTSYKLNLFFDGGTVQDLVVQCLKSDNAFLVEKSDGRLSLRKWGESYGAHNLSAWQITQQPEKSYLENKYYASTVRVKYDGGETVNTSQENKLLELYRKSSERTFETDLALEADAVDLAGTLVSRLGNRADTFKVSLGVDLSGISILDTVTLDLEINKRRLSNNTEWIVKEIDVAQDTMTIEAAT